MKNFVILLLASFTIFGCSKEKTYTKNIQHKWQHVNDDFKFTDGTPDISTGSLDAEYWSFNNGLLEKTYASESTSNTYTIEKDQLKTKGQGNIVGIDFNYTIESISDEKMVLLYTLTNDAGEKNGELNMNFKRVD